MKKILLLSLFMSSALLHAQTGSWAELGSGVGKQGEIQTIAVDDTGYVYAPTTNEYDNQYVSKWNGTTWSALGGTNSFSALAGITPNSELGGDITSIVIDNAGNLYVAGNIQANVTPYISKWSGGKWSKVQTGNDTVPLTFAKDLALDNSGNLYAVGSNGVCNCSVIVKWNGSNWSILPYGISGMNSDSLINQIIADNSGNLYAAGALYDHVNGTKYYVAKWNGTTWSQLGTGVNALNANGRINAMTMDNGGNIYVAGNFTDANGVYYTAKWNGTTWSELGTGANALNSDGLGTNGAVYALATDKSGNVYMGGLYDYSLMNVWQWNGTSWNQLGAGKNGLFASNPILTIAVDPSENVYAAGSFQDQSYYFEVEKWTTTSAPTASIAPQSQTGIAVYPNPGHDQVSIQTPENGQLTVYAVSGQPVLSQPVSAGNSYLDLANLTTGMYTLVFTGQTSSYPPVKWIRE
jgi:hypothetical protein